MLVFQFSPRQFCVVCLLSFYTLLCWTFLHLYVSDVSYKQHTFRFCFIASRSDRVYLLIGEFSQFIFNVIINVFEC